MHGAWTIEITLPNGPKIGASTFKKLEVSAVHLKVQLFEFRSGIFQNLCSKLEISSQYGPDSLKI